ncbi:MAG: acyltransferase [Rhodanobacter sp.]|nr:MAG: acyltransferase [Rhodanobacter sp.]
MSSHMSDAELGVLGLASCGHNVLISRKASIYGAGRIHIGNNVRIDDFSILSAGDGGIHIGNYVHIASYASVVGREKIQMSDFSGISSRVCVYSSSDDYSGNALTNPTVPPDYTAVRHAPVLLGRHTIVGAGSVILPGVILHDGVAIGALALVTHDCAEFGVYAGVPARRISARSRHLLILESQMAAQGKV